MAPVGAMHEQLPDLLGRHIAIDERGIGLRATWRPAHGFINVSLWRDSECVETFHLAPDDAGELIAFLGRSLAMTTPRASAPGLRLVNAPEPKRESVRQSIARITTRVRTSASDLLAATAARVRP